MLASVLVALLSLPVSLFVCRMERKLYDCSFLFFLWRRDIDFAVSAESPLLFEKQQGSGWSVFVLGRAIQPTAAAAAAATAAASRHDAAATVPTQEFPDAATDVRPAALRRPE